MSVENGTASIDDGSLIFKAENYRKLADSLDKLLNQGTVDTVVLIERAMIYDLSNNQLAKPFAGDKGAYEQLLKAKILVEKAVDQKVHSIVAKILHAQIYRDLTYRFGDDQGWKYSSKEISGRRALFEKYKASANRYYLELIRTGVTSAADYQRLLVKTNYPIPN